MLFTILLPSFWGYLTIIPYLACLSIEIPPEARLREYLRTRYYWPVRPVKNESDQLIVLARYNLARVAGLDLKGQVLTLNLKIDHEWIDYKMKWNPDDYEGINQINIPTEQIWVPDLQLFETFGNFDLYAHSVAIYSNGLVKWQPTSIIKSFCRVEIRSYPFDIQSCNFTFGSWTYDGNKLWITFKDIPKYKRLDKSVDLPEGMVLCNYFPSAEFEIISIPANLMYTTYPCCEEAYIRIAFKITLRRHAHFYLANVVLPLVGLSYLSLLVFYLPADSGEKIVLCVSLLTSQIMFLLLMIDNIPVTSLAVPLLGKLIIFNMITLFLSICCTTIVLNVHHRKPATHDMPKWVKNLGRNRFIMRMFCMMGEDIKVKHSKVFPMREKFPKSVKEMCQLCSASLEELSDVGKGKYPGHVEKAMQDVYFVREYVKQQQDINQECEHWKLLALLMDRAFFILFNCAFIIGMSLILMDAPALFDQRQTVDKHLELKNGRCDEVM